MVLEKIKEVHETAKSTGDLKNTVAAQVAEIVKEDRRLSDDEQLLPPRWFYRTPFAGVRYYRY